MKKTYSEKEMLMCLRDIIRILPEGRYVTNNTQSIAVAHLLSIAARYCDPMSVQLEQVLEISEEEGVRVDDLIRGIGESKWKELTALCTKYGTEVFSAVARYENENAFPSLFAPGTGMTPTPDSIKRLALDLLDIQDRDCVADLCCGAGGVAMEIHRRCPQCSIHGYEINSEAATVAAIRCAHSGGGVKIHTEDVLSPSILNSGDRFNKIFADYPFGLRTQEAVNSRIVRDMMDNGRVLTREVNADWLFNNRIMELLSEDGKAVAIMTRGGAQNNIYKQFRKMFVEDGFVEAVIELPERIFRNTNIAALLVVMSRGNSDVRFVDASELYQKGRRFNEIGERDIAQILACLTEDTQISRSVSVVELADNDFVLVPSRYLKQETVADDGVPFGDLMLDITRGAHCTAEQVDAMSTTEKTEIRYLKNGDIQDGMFSEDMQCLSYVEKNFERYCVRDRDLVVSKNSSPIKAAVASIGKKQKVLASANLYVITINESKANPHYILAYLTSSEGQAQIKHITAGTRVPSIGAKELKELRIPLPPMDKQMEIGRQYEAQVKRVAKLKKQLAQEIERLDSVFGNGMVD